MPLSLRNHRITLVLAAFAAFAVAAPCAAAGWKGDFADAPKRALVIGNANYRSVGALKNSLNDAQDVCGALKDLGFQSTCRFDIASRVEMRAVIQDFVDALPANAVSLVYYAGHAVQVQGENFLLPTGATMASDAELISSSVELSFLVRQLRRVETSLNLVILDACRNNPLSGEGREVLARGLAQVTDVPDRSVVLYATGAGGLANDGQGRNGILTKHLLASIRDPGTVSDLFRTVGAKVQQETEAATGRAQTPALYTNFSGQFCFLNCTDLQWLQRQKQEAADKVAALEARIASGDLTARGDLKRIEAENRKLADEIKRKEREALKTKRKAEEQKKDRNVMVGT